MNVFNTEMVFRNTVRMRDFKSFNMYTFKTKPKKFQNLIKILHQNGVNF